MNRFVLGLTLVLASPLVLARPAAAQDMEALVERAEEVFESDYARWGGFRFSRRVNRERFDKNGGVNWSAEYLMEIEPTKTGFDERLVEIDGRIPTPEEVLEHRRAGRFAKHYESAGGLENPFGKPIPLLPLLFDQRHELVGRRMVRGLPCLKTEFSARNPPSRLPARRRLEYALRGEACFSIPGNHLVSAELETSRAVSAGVVKLQYLRILIEGGPQGGGEWLPSRFEVRSEIRLGVTWLRKSNRYQYSKFKRPEG